MMQFMIAHGATVATDLPTLAGGLRLNGINKKSRPGKPLVTIITATFNGAEQLPIMIQSVRDQIYDNIEWIVIDGNSTDETVAVLRSNEDVIDYWVSEPDRGIYDAWNKGIALARGEWIAFLGCDDSYYPDAVEQYVRYLAANDDRQFDYVSSKLALVNARHEIIEVIGRAWSWSRFRKKMVVAHVGSLHHRRLYERYGLYDTTYKSAADYELLLRFHETLRAGFLDVITASMQYGGVSNYMFPALAEAKRAKHETGGRSNLLCSLDNMVDMTKIILKRTLNRSYRCTS